MSQMSVDTITEYSREDDVYPSRVLAKPSLQSRQDPVICGDINQSVLDSGQIEFYKTNGFLLIESLFSENEVKLFQRELDLLHKDETILNRREAVTEKVSNNKALRSLFQVHFKHKLFSKLACDERLVRIAEYILGSQVYIHQSRLNFKPGLFGKEFYWHSDFETWHMEDGMPRMRALSMSISLTDNNQFNGPLMLIPGSHRTYVACVGETPEDHYKQSLQQQEIGVPDPDSLRYLERQRGIAAPTGKAGSVLIFDCNTIHGSNSNISPCPRSNVFFVYNSVENKLVRPFCGKSPRPEFIASRKFIQPVNAQKIDYGKVNNE